MSDWQYATYGTLFLQANSLMASEMAPERVPPMKLHFSSSTSSLARRNATAPFSWSSR